jgi:aspartate racemase
VKPRHIGIVACSSEGAALAYRTICIEGAAPLGPHAHPEVSLHGHSLAAYVDAIGRDDWEAVGGLMLDSAAKLARGGADLLVCPDNTIHQAMPLIADRLPLPFLLIVDIVADEAAARGVRRAALLGTRSTMTSKLYPERLRSRGIGCAIPGSEERDRIESIIMDELVLGTVNPASTVYLQRIIEEMKADGCDAVVLGCTEIPLVINDGNSALPTLDSTRLLARAALRAAIR